MAGRKILLLLCMSLPITDISFSTIKNYIRASNNLRQKMNVPKILLSFLLSVQELSCVRCGTAQPLPAPLCWVPLWVQLHCRFPPRSSAGALKHGVLLVRAVLQGEESSGGEVALCSSDKKGVLWSAHRSHSSVAFFPPSCLGVGECSMWHSLFHNLF